MHGETMKKIFSVCMYFQKVCHSNCTPLSILFAMYVKHVLKPCRLSFHNALMSSSHSKWDPCQKMFREVTSTLAWPVSWMFRNWCLFLHGNPDCGVRCALPLCRLWQCAVARPIVGPMSHRFRRRSAGLIINNTYTYASLGLVFLFFKFWLEVLPSCKGSAFYLTKDVCVLK
jgi:hypothetical protein